MRFEKIKSFGAVLVVALLGITILLRNTDYVLLRNAIGYVFMGVLIIYFIILYVNRYR